MEETCSSKTMVDLQWTTRHHIPEDRTLHNHRGENLKSYVGSEDIEIRGNKLKRNDCGEKKETGDSLSINPYKMEIMLQEGGHWCKVFCCKLT
jgi:hypothetical protein